MSKKPAPTGHSVVHDTPRPAPKPVHPAQVIVHRGQPVHPVDPNAGLTSAQQSIYTYMTTTLKAWGLGVLIPDMKKYLTQGMGSNEIQLNLENTDAWKARFAGNEIRQEKGLPVLTPAQYLATEQAYRQTLAQYGLPAGFYDQHSDFTNLIGNDVSASELSARAQIAHDQYMNAPQAYKDMWAQYGYSKGDAIAAILDPKTATTVLQDRSIQVGIGAEAKMQGLNVSRDRAIQLQQAGTTIQQAKAAYSKIAQIYNTDQNIAGRFGTTFTQNDEENDLLLGNGQAASKRAALYAEEQGLFNGHAAADSNTVGVSQSY